MEWRRGHLRKKKKQANKSCWHSTGRIQAQKLAFNRSKMTFRWILVKPKDVDYYARLDDRPHVQSSYGYLGKIYSADDRPALSHNRKEG